MSTALVPVNMSRKDLTLAEQKELAQWAFKSGEFKDLKSPMHAMILMSYGRELGFGPATSLQLVYSVKGTPALKANTIAALMKQVRWRDTNAPRYDYRVKERSNTRCVITFYERNDAGVMEERGDSDFTWEDAERAGLTKNQTYAKYPRQMLFARCITEGARVYAPDCLGGIVPYCPEEVGYTGPEQTPALPAHLLTGEGDGAEVIEAEYTPCPAPETETTEDWVEALKEKARAKGADWERLIRNVGLSGGEEGILTPSELRSIENLLDNL